MDQFINNPGLQHITENILLNLDFKNFKVCQSANIKFEQILANPIFWLKSPGLQSLQQINEDVFLDFDFEDLEFLKSVNETFAEILGNSTFCFKKMFRIRKLLVYRYRTFYAHRQRTTNCFNPQIKTFPWHLFIIFMFQRIFNVYNG